MIKYIIFDRDGTLIEHIHHLTDPSKVKIYQDAFESLKILSENRFRFGIISNQSVIGRGLASDDLVRTINSIIEESFRKYGIIFDFIKYCPHHPMEKCSCRKPNSQMGEKAISEYGIDTSQSYMVGDQNSDLLFGKACKVKTVGVNNININKALCDIYAENLLEAAKKIIKDSRITI